MKMKPFDIILITAFTSAIGVMLGCLFTMATEQRKAERELQQLEKSNRYKAIIVGAQVTNDNDTVYLINFVR